MTNNCENRLLSLLSAQEWHLDRLYAEYARQFGSIFRNYSGTTNKLKQKELDRAMVQFHDDLEKLLSDQINNSFGISDLCNDEAAEKYLKDLDISSDQKASFLKTNSNAAKAFVSRKQAGLNLSERVWNLTNQTQASLNNALESGIFDGRPAADMARDLKRYLKEPDQRFRRVKNEQGKLILSNPAKDYHPGQGVYRSSYKNALRLSRNEVNIAYRTNDFERRKNMPWVMGQRVRLSNAHPRYDICDELVGTYPKEFKFVGWHPNCLCIADSLLLPRSKFKEYLAGGGIDQRHLIKNVPKNALDYLNDNAERIKGWKNKPYFLRDNFKMTKTGFVPNANIQS